MKNNLLVCRVDQTFGFTNLFTPIISSKKNKKNEFILTNLESNKNVSDSATTSTDIKIIEFDSSKLFPNEIRYMGQFYIKSTTLSEHDKMYLVELYKWKYGWKKPLMEGFEYCMSDRGNHAILLYIIREKDESRSEEQNLHVIIAEDHENIEDFTENENFMHDLEYYGEQFAEMLENLDTTENLEFIRNQIALIDENYIIDNSLNLPQLYSNFLGHIISRHDNDTLLGPIFQTEDIQLGLLFDIGNHEIDEFVPTIQQFGQLLETASNEDFLVPFLELYKQNEAYRILSVLPDYTNAEKDDILTIIQNTFGGSDQDIYTWLLNLDNILGTETIQGFFQHISILHTVGDFETFFQVFVRNRTEIFQERVLSNRFTNGQNVEMLPQDVVVFYRYIKEHIETSFHENPYIQAVGELPIVFSTAQEFDEYTATISQLIQEDRQIFFDRLLDSLPTWNYRQRLMEILQMGEDDIGTIVEEF